jgi:hypothetical protein
MKFILIFILFLIALNSSAQQNEEILVKENGVSITIGHNQLKEENLHPKVFSGLTIGTSYFHSVISRNISEFSAGVKISAVNTAHEDFPSALSIQILASYKYLLSIARSQNFNFRLGPVAGLQYGTSAYFNWDESHFYFANYVSGGLANRISYYARNKTFDFHLDIPLISCIFRPEFNRQYKIDDMTARGIFTNLASNPKAALPGKNFYLKTGIEMKYPSRRKKTRAVGYNFKYHYMQAASGNPYQNIENNVSYRFIFQP